MEKIGRALKYYAQEAGDREAIDMRSQLISLIDPSVDTRIGVHVSTFNNNINLQFQIKLLRLLIRTCSTVCSKAPLKATVPRNKWPSTPTMCRR